MAEFEPNGEHAGGMASLQVAEAHLTTLLNLSSSLDGKAMFIVGADLALFGVFVGAIAALNASWLAVIPPGAVMIAIAAFGWRTVRPGDLIQFPSPSDVLALAAGGRANDELAWIYVDAINGAALDAAGEVGRKRTALIWLAAGSALQVVVMAVTLALV